MLLHVSQATLSMRALLRLENGLVWKLEKQLAECGSGA